MKRRVVNFCDVGVKSTNWTFGGLLLLLLIYGLSSCSNPTGTKYVNYPVQFAWPAFRGPNTSVNNSGVVKTDSIISLFNSFIPQDIRDLCSGTPSTQSDSFYVWTGHDRNGDAVSWTAISVYEQGMFGIREQYWVWKYRVNGKVKYSVNIEFGGKIGFFDLYAGDSLLADEEGSWNLGAYGASGALYEWDKSRAFLCIDNPDKSGSLSELGEPPDTLTYFKSKWNADGSGEWWDYDTTGNISYHGSWR